MNAIGKVMGLKVTIKNVTFDDIITGMVAGRYIIGASSFTDTKAREKQVNFVDYANVGESFYTLKSGGDQHQGHQLDLRADGLGRDGHDRGGTTPRRRARSAPRRTRRP